MLARRRWLRSALSPCVRPSLNQPRLLRLQSKKPRNLLNRKPRHLLPCQLRERPHRLRPQRRRLQFPTNLQRAKVLRLSSAKRATLAGPRGKVAALRVHARKILRSCHVRVDAPARSNCRRSVAPRRPRPWMPTRRNVPSEHPLPSR